MFSEPVVAIDSSQFIGYTHAVVWETAPHFEGLWIRHYHAVTQGVLCHLHCGPDLAEGSSDKLMIFIEYITDGYNLSFLAWSQVPSISFFFVFSSRSLWQVA